jgi:isopenicillin N synthase-like dioxygenase
MAVMNTVPTIELSGTRSDPAAADRAANEIDRACREIGFFTVTGHGVPEAIDRACWDTARAFFDLPEAEKAKVAFPYPGYPYGYSAVAGETLAQSLGQAAPPDLKESLAIGPLDRPSTPPGDADEAFAYSANQWPEAPRDLRPAWEAYYRAMEGLAAHLMGLFARSLDLPADFFADKIDRHISAMRAINYPAQATPPAPGQLRAGAHSDYGSLTILRQEAAPGGLQVRGPDGVWVDVPAVPGSYVINIGDLMARWTNDRWVSTLHRVINPPREAEGTSTGSTRRQSIAFFHQPNWDAVIACLPSCRDAGGGAKYAPVTSGAHLMGKFRATVGATEETTP